MQHTSQVVIFALLVLFGIYRRTRRSIGFQRFVKGRMLTRMILFIIIGIMFLMAGVRYPLGYTFDAGGMVLGGILAYYAIRTTSFEWRKDAWFYRPNPWIGVLLVVLFVGRLAFRMYYVYALLGSGVAANGAAAKQSQLAAYSNDPITAIFLFTLITYYLAYYTFLIRRARHLDIKEQGTTEDA